MHRALAAAMRDQPTHDARAWHLATATANPDEEVATELEATAQSARRRGGYAAAALAFEKAARLTLDREEQARRLLEAADGARLGGLSENARVLLDEALALATRTDLRAEIGHLRGLVEMWGGRPMAAHGILVSAATEVEPSDREKSASMLADAVFPCFIAGNSRAGLDTAHRAQILAAQVGGSVETLADALVGAASILRGEPRDAREIVLRFRPLLEQGDALSRSDQLMHFAGALLVWIEEYDFARHLITRTLDAARAASAPGVLPYGLAALSALDFRTGNWPAAYAAASECHQLATETGQSAAAAHGFVCVARVEAAQGRATECREHAERALAIASELEAGAVPMFVNAILGLLELGSGRPLEASIRLDEAAQLADELGLGEAQGVALAG